MSPRPGCLHDPPWCRRDVLGLLVLCAVGGASLIPAAAGRRAHFDPDAAGDADRVRAATEVIDPATAPAASLRRLPDVGEARARDIVAYREAHGPRAFRRAADLARIRGIGPATVQKIAPYLKFPQGP